MKAVSQWKEVGSHKRVALSMPYVGKTGLIAHAEVLAGTSNESPIDVEHWDGGPRREDVPTNGSEGTGRRRAVMLPVLTEKDNVVNLETLYADSKAS